MPEGGPAAEHGERPGTAGPGVAHATPDLRPAAFLDRDGTIIAERDYLADPAGVELLPGAIAGLRALRDAGYALVLVSNQSGIARGLYGIAEYQAVQARLEDLLRQDDVAADASYFCPHHPDFTGPCDCRKPAPGLYHRAAADLDLDLARSLFIGDKLSDVLPAATFGGTALLVRTGYGRGEEARAAAAVPGLLVADDLGAIAAPDWPGWRLVAR